MNKKMPGYPCEPTAAGTSCTDSAGTGGNDSETALLQDELTGALIGLARATDGSAALSDETCRVIIEGLFTTMPNVRFDQETVRRQIQKVRQEKQRLAPECSRCTAPCGRNAEYDMAQIRNADPDVRSCKSLILSGIHEIAAHACHTATSGYTDPEIGEFLCDALFEIGYEETADALEPLARKVDEVKRRTLFFAAGCHDNT